MSHTLDPSVHVLLVDDDCAQLRILEHVLREQLGSEIVLETYSDSRAALHRIDAGGIDILLSDLVMPRIDGVELLRRAKERNRATQVLLMTATCDLDSLLEANELGATDYLLKPVHRAALVDLVRQAAQRAQRWQTALAGAFKRKHREDAAPTASAIA